MNPDRFPNDHTMAGNNASRITLRKAFLLVRHRRKYLLIATTLTVLLVFLFNSFSDPVYESIMILKKESPQDLRSADELGKIIAMQTLDEIETEVEIIKSRSVLEKLLQDLFLTCEIKKISLPSGEFYRASSSYPDYLEFLKSSGGIADKFPTITQIASIPDAPQGHYHLLVSGRNQVTVSQDHQTILSQNMDQAGNISLYLPTAFITFHWPNAAIGSSLQFTLKNREKVLDKLFSSIAVKRVGKTNLFQVSVKAGTPLAAQVIAHTLVEQFREVRLEQKQQTIRYSYNFVDEQLNDTEQRLRLAEDTLSKFKSRHQITSIDKNSAEIINFLSRLEGEKLTIDLQLTEYENRLAHLRRELQEKGYFDQTYLTPTGSDESYTPFSTLLRELSDLELKKLELLQRRKESHPDVVTLNEQIDQVKTKLSSYNQNTLTAYEIINKSLREKRNSISNLIDTYSARIEKLPETETRLAELIRQRDALEKKFSLLLDKREEMRMAELSKLQDIVVIDAAQQPVKPVFPRKKLNLVIGLFGGLMLGLLAVFIKEYFSEKISDLEYIEKELKLPLLGILPPYDKDLDRRIKTSNSLDDRLVTLMEREHGFKESFRILRVKLLGNFTRKNRMALITSCEENSGKTTISANLAISLAQAGEKVLLVDGDLHKGTLGKMFDIPADSPGLIEYFQGKAILNEICYSRVLEQKLQVIPAGRIKNNSGELPPPENLSQFFREVQSIYSVIIIDAPPVTKVADPLLLGKIIKNVILIVKPDLTYKEGIRGAVEEFRQAGMNLVGVIANACDIAHSFYRYRYGYGYGYYHKNR